MHVLQTLICLFGCFLLVACDSGERTSTTANAAPPFAAGQLWRYLTRPGEEASRIIICRVETDPKLGQIVHIHVAGVRLKNKHAPGGMSDQIGHMPYSGAALAKYVTKLESSGVPLPAFEEGYKEWRSAFDKSKGGVWTAPLTDAIAGVEKALNQ